VAVVVEEDAVDIVGVQSFKGQLKIKVFIKRCFAYND